jgi:hypothetical protein
MKFHEWVIEERDKLTAHPADPFEAAKIGAALSPAGQKERRVEGIAIFSTSRVLIDVTGVQQLSGLASELAKQTAGKAQAQQDSVLAPRTAAGHRQPVCIAAAPHAAAHCQARQLSRAERPNPDRRSLVGTKPMTTQIEGLRARPAQLLGWLRSATRAGGRSGSTA